MNLSPATFNDLRKVIHNVCGLVVSDDKEYLVRDRLEGLIRQRGMTGFDELCERLQRRPEDSLVSAVIDAVTTQETSFFRDPHVFDVLAREIFPRLVKQGTQLHRPVRILSAGTSTGQEAYSLAILACEATRELGSTTPNSLFSILAGDVSLHALERAKAGVYDQREIARGLTATQIQRYFNSVETKFRASESIRKLIEFRRINLADSFTALGEFELICCRNVMIYFDDRTRRRICQQFHQMLANDGWLLLGTAESLYGISADFVSVLIGNVIVYQKARPPGS
jgi:chemotaxis protein methyltransferase CheR